MFKRVNAVLAKIMEDVFVPVTKIKFDFPPNKFPENDGVPMDYQDVFTPYTKGYLDIPLGHMTDQHYHPIDVYMYRIHDSVKAHLKDSEGEPKSDSEIKDVTNKHINTLVKAGLCPPIPPREAGREAESRWIKNAQRISLIGRILASLNAEKFIK